MGGMARRERGGGRGEGLEARGGMVLQRHSQGKSRQNFVHQSAALQLTLLAHLSASVNVLASGWLRGNCW